MENKKTKPQNHFLHNSWPSIEKYDMKCLWNTLQTHINILININLILAQ